MNERTPKVLALDDDEHILAILESALIGDGYAVISAQSIEEFERKIRFHVIDLFVLDISIPRANGVDLAKRIRALSDVGLIFLTGRGDEVDRIIGLEIGADDYIVKPFSIRELRSRARAVLRRTWGKRYALDFSNEKDARAPAGEIQFQEFTLSFRRRSVVHACGAELDLTSMEFDVLAILARRLGEIVTRNDLLCDLKGQAWSPSDRAVDNLISRLRRKLSSPENREAHIKTVRGRGYLLVT